MTSQHKSEHITKEQWTKFSQRQLSEIEEEKFYQHIGTCTYCAEEFTKIIEQDFFLEPPVYLEEEILERTKKADVQAAVAVKKTSKKVQLLFYSLKVGFAVAASIFLLTMTTQIDQINMQVQMPKKAEQEMTIMEKINKGSSHITQRLKDTTNQIFERSSKEAEK